VDIHEYQAKDILSGYGVKIAEGGLAYSPERCRATRQRNRWACVGGKSTDSFGCACKSGGIKICKTHDEVEAAADYLLVKDW